MAKTAKSISASKLAGLTREAVRSVSEVKGKFVGRGPILGFVAPDNLEPKQQLALASQITDAITLIAKDQALPALRPKPIVVHRPGTIIAGYLASELAVRVR